MIPYFIGLAGYSGAGKSTVVAYLEQMGGAAAFPIDNFYKDEDDCPRLDGRPHWDLPESLHLDRLYEALVELKTGEDVQIPVYEKAVNRAVGRRVFRPRPVVLVEGLMLYTEPRIRELMDLRLWMDVPKEVALARKWQREPERFDRAYYEQIALPAIERYVDPTKAYAHYTIDGMRRIHEIACTMDEVIRRTFG